MSFKTRIRNKRDTASNWEANNPVLLDGELIVVNTNAGNVRFKIGDGTKTYTQLPFQDEAIYNALSGKANAADIGVLEGAIEALRTEMNTAFDDRIVAEDEGELTTELPEMFGGRTAEEYALKTDLENVSGLPSGSSPNQYLVTDGEGNAKWEDKLAWSGLEFLLDEQELASEKEGEFQARVAIFSDIKGGEIYTVTWDGVAYPCVCQESAGNFYLGNVAAFGSPDDTGEPFAIRLEWVDEEGGFYGTTILAQNGVSHTVGIATETIHPIDKKYLPSGGGTTILYNSNIERADGSFAIVYEDGSEAVVDENVESGHFIVRYNFDRKDYFVPQYVTFTNGGKCANFTDSSGQKYSIGDIGAPV